MLSALILKLCRYTTWPDEAFSGPDESLVIGVWKDDEIYQTLEKLARSKKLTIDVQTYSANGSSSRSRQVDLSRLEVLPKPEEIDVLLIAESRKKDLEQIGKLYGDRPILTIGLDRDMAKKTCILSVFIEERRVAFQASKKNSKTARLEIHSSILRNAKEVFK
ncbi:MAG: YfiR family protein [Planctomycetota bacterium]